jgi:hypothetical protein
MNETEAKKLTERIVGTWPASPKGFVWTEVLLPLDATVARVAVDRLTREHEEARLAVARFLAVYLAAVRNAGTDEPRHPEPDDGPVMSFAQYQSRLTTKAARGDTDAVPMLDVWDQNMARMPKGWPTP